VIKNVIKSEKGFSLIETVIATALLGIIAVGLLSAFNTSSKVLSVASEREIAKNLAEHQMEIVKNQNYAPSYTPASIPSQYMAAGYSVTIAADNINSRDGNIQKIRVIVNHQGRPIILAANSTLEGYKVNR